MYLLRPTCIQEEQAPLPPQGQEQEQPQPQEEERSKSKVRGGEKITAAIAREMPMTLYYLR